MDPKVVSTEVGYVCLSYKYRCASMCTLLVGGGYVQIMLWGSPFLLFTTVCPHSGVPQTQKLRSPLVWWEPRAVMGSFFLSLE